MVMTMTLTCGSTSTQGTPRGRAATHSTNRRLSHPESSRPDSTTATPFCAVRWRRPSTNYVVPKTACQSGGTSTLDLCSGRFIGCRWGRGHTESLSMTYNVEPQLHRRISGDLVQNHVPSRALRCWSSLGHIPNPLAFFIASPSIWNSTSWHSILPSYFWVTFKKLVSLVWTIVYLY